MVWTEMKGNRYLLYIGRSGKKEGDVIVHRKAGLGGMKDRLVNGHQFGKISRRRSWPIVMEELGIQVLDINWYDTEEDNPIRVEKELLDEVVEVSGQLPPWNLKKE